MRPIEALTTLHRMGLVLAPSGDRLNVTPRDKITPEARVLIVQHRDDLLKLVSARPGGEHAVSPASITDNVPILGNRDYATAKARASADHGTPQWSAVADSQRERILERLDALPAARNDDGRHLLGRTRSFFETEHRQTAVALGWSPIELFGIDPYAPLTCLDRQGVVSGLALSRFKGGYLENIAGDHAGIRRRSGSLLTYRRGSVGFDEAVLWWECPALFGSPEHAL